MVYLAWYFICSSQGETLETLTMATVCLFSAQPQLADQVPPLGHLPKVLQAMNHRNNAIPKSAIRVVHALSDNEVLINPQEPRTPEFYLCPLDNTSECQSLSPVCLYLSVLVISRDGTYSLLNRKVGFKLHFITVELTLLYNILLYNCPCFGALSCVFEPWHLWRPLAH